MQPGSEIPAGLPSPDADSLRHTEAVTSYIHERIAAAGGAITFGEFMQHALYAPGLGYYTAGTRKFGRAGDFVTAPEVSPLFGRVIATQCRSVLNALDGASILELGAGSGALAVSLLGRLAELGALPDRYLILDVSPDLVARQRRAIEDALPELLPRVEWLGELPEGFDGVVIANEVADALPVECFERAEGEIRQLCVTVVDDGFASEYRSASEALATRVTSIETALGRNLTPGYRSQVSLALPAWVEELAAAVANGVILFFDYGLPRAEYYADGRSSGWLRCHFRHHVHGEPLIYPGIQDITCWVDFTSIAEAGRRAGTGLAGFVTQAMFLLHGGLDNEFAAFDELAVVDQLELARQAKLLTMPDEMGEHFKCLGLVKGRAPVPDTFANGSRAHAL